MPWTYKAFGDSSLDSVLVELHGKANQLAASRTASVKLATSNQEDGSARGVLFWYDGELPDRAGNGSGWQRHTQDTGDNYEGLYDFVRDTLNGVSLERALLSHVAFSNHHTGHHSAVVSVWVPATVS
ncbi:MAG: hypothetical protein AAF604_01690 [Acidobacteriota bacterium]